MKKKIILFLALFCLSIHTFAQLQKAVKWAYAAKRLNSNEVIFYIKGTMDAGWHIYSLAQLEGGPLKTSVRFTPVKGMVFVGKPIEPKPIKKFEPVFDMNVFYHEGSVTFIQKAKYGGNGSVVKGKIEFMACNNQQCLPPDEVVFSIPIK